MLPRPQEFGEGSLTTDLSRINDMKTLDKPILQPSLVPTKLSRYPISQHFISVDSSNVLNTESSNLSISPSMVSLIQR